MGTGGAPRLGLEVTVENRSGHALTTRIGIEWNLTMLGGGGNPAAWYEVAGERTAHDGSGAIDGVTAVRQGNDHVGVIVDTSVEPAADAWWAPIDTISNSENGFERVYQGSALLLSWPLTLGPGAAPRVPRRPRRDHHPRPRARGRRMSRGRLVVHGHFYQPLRVDPFSGTVPADPSAAPFDNWNARVAAECYRPNAERRNLGQMSWDLGPTLAEWLETGDPKAYRGFIDGDRPADRDASIPVSRGNGMAQSYHHAIAALASAADRRTEIRWGMRDFLLRFGRDAEGLWFPETGD